jgi:hypothetical protein
MSAEFAIAGLTADQLNALVKRHGGPDGVLRFLRGETSVSEPTRSWREENGIIFFSVTSDGTTGEGWIERLESKGVCVGDAGKLALLSPKFKPASGVTTDVAVLKGMLFKSGGRGTKEIIAKASERKLSNPKAEVACLIRDRFTNEAIGKMGLRSIVVMHEPITEASSYPVRLAASGWGWNVGDNYLSGFTDITGHQWDPLDGFAFASQVGSQS